MKEQTEFRRYLVNVDSDSTSQRFTDCLIIGSGIAGSFAALRLAEKHPEAKAILIDVEPISIPKKYFIF